MRGFWGAQNQIQRKETHCSLWTDCSPAAGSDLEKQCSKRQREKDCSLESTRRMEIVTSEDVRALVKGGEVLTCPSALESFAAVICLANTKQTEEKAAYPCVWCFVVWFHHCYPEKFRVAFDRQKWNDHWTMQIAICSGPLQTVVLWLTTML